MNSPATEKKSRRWRRRLVIGALAAPLVIAILGFWVAPPVVRHVAESQLGNVLGRRVGIGRVRLNPFSLTVAIEDFQLFEADGRTPFVGFRRLFINAQWESLYRRAPVLREVSLEGPRIRLVRLKATPDAWADTTAYNFSDILAHLAAQEEAEEEPSPPPDQGPARFSLNNIRISDGQFTFDDRPLASSHTISGFDLGVPFVSTLPTFIDTFVEPGLRLIVDGTPFALAGRTKPFKDSLETTIELRARAFDLTRYLPYVPTPLGFELLSALLDLEVDVSFVRPSSEGARLTARGRVALNDVRVREKGGAPLATLRQFEVVVGKADLTEQSFDVKRVTLAGLELHVQRRRDGTLNLDRLAPEPPPSGPAAGANPKSVKSDKSARAAKPKTGAPRFHVGEIVAKDVAVHLRDETVRPTFLMELDQLGVSVRGLTNKEGASAAVSFGLHAAPGGTLKGESALTLTPLTARGTVGLDGIEPGRFAPYFRDQIAFDLRQGRVRLGASYAVSGLGAPVAPGPSTAGRAAGTAAASPHVELTDAFVEVADLALRRRDAKEDFLRVPTFAVRGVKVDSTLRAVTVGEIVTHGGLVRAERDQRGVIDWSTLAAPAQGHPTGGPPTPPVASPQSTEPARARSPSTPGWSVQLTRLECEGWSARFADRMTTPRAAITISPLGIKATGLGTTPGTRGTLDVRLGINKRGRLSVAGSVTLEPLVADLRVDLRALEILPLQPYFADQINLLVTDGTVSVKGRAKIEPPATGPPAPKGGAGASSGSPRVAFTGDIDVASFASVDGSKHEEFLKWKSLHVGQLAVTTQPMRLSIRDVALTDFYSRLVVFPDAHFNVQDVLTPPAAVGKASQKPRETKAATPVGPAQPPRDQPVPITIGQVTLQGGNVNFSDRLIRPNYSAALTELAGRVSGLSADGSTQADVDIRGSVDHSGRLSIVGKMNPLAKDLFVDVKVDLKEFELPPTSPYAARYAGYGITKGKLALALDYHIADRKLDAKNRLVVEQFTFGDKVNSPEATNLPVRLAVAILKDRHGVIDIDLPIAGSLDSPDFKIWRAVLKVLGNLIVKAATAPFSMIASLFGGGEELSHLEFKQGEATLDGKARQKLTALAKALRERPGLSFEIEGGADPVRDRESLKRYLHERTLQGQKMLELVQGGAPVSDPESIRLDAAERPRLLEKAYRAATFPKPRNMLGRPKELPPVEMEKLLMANTLVDDDALRTLAERRASAVREALARIAPDGATRLFLVTPHLSKPSDPPGNRADFKLKKN